MRSKILTVEAEIDLRECISEISTDDLIEELNNRKEQLSDRGIKQSPLDLYDLFHGVNARRAFCDVLGVGYHTPVEQLRTGINDLICQ